MADSTIITNQYVQIDQTPASVGDRILGRLIDYILIVIYCVAISVIMGLYAKYAPYSDFTVVYIFFLLPAMFYSLIWEIFNQGQTPGKRLLGIRVVMKDGTTPGMGAYLLRWLFLLVDVFVSYGLGTLAILLSKNNQRFGDMAAGTLVIKEKDFHKINVTLDEFKHLGTDYYPLFPQAENLSLEQVNLINQTLFRYDNERPRRIRELAEQVRTFLKINPAVNDEHFLQTITRDFQYYALEEV
ncbi:MAG: RDD family protein [Tannerella sp.]|jgi:uncharacterized RDD family membrane protein YckC|nr:RDD family protein [Tannerella sp.]